MKSQDWIPEEKVRELSEVLRARKITCAGLLFFIIMAGFGAIQALNAGKIGESFTLGVIVAILFLYMLHVTYHALLYRHHMMTLIERQERDVANATVQMLAEIEVNLSKGGNNENEK